MSKLHHLIPYSLSEVKNGGVLRSSNILKSFNNIEIIQVIFCEGALYVNGELFRVSKLTLWLTKLKFKILNFHDKINIVDILSYVYILRNVSSPKDLVIIENLCYKHTIKLSIKRKLKIIYNSHNFDVNYSMLHGNNGVYERKALKLLNESKNCLVLCCSQREKNEYQKYMRFDQILVIPNGTNRVYRTSGFTQEMNSKEFYFIGDMTTIANLEAITFLLDFWETNKIEFKLYIVGRINAEIILPKNVVFLGQLSSEELDSFLCIPRILIVPIFKGEGTRLKILEAFANRNIVISTPKGIEGLEFKKNVNYIEFQTSEDLVKIFEHIDSLIHQLDSLATQHILEKNYYWDTISSLLFDKLFLHGYLNKS